MKTDDLVRLLATGEGRVPRHAAARRYAVALSLGAITACGLMLGLLGVRPDLGDVIHVPMFWIKIAYVASLAMASLPAVLHLSRPGARVDWVLVVLAAPILVMWTLGADVLAGAEPTQRMALLFGKTWLVCPFLIAMLSAPTFTGALWAMRGLAPTHLPLAGAVAGLLSGTVGALVYCLHCPELAAPFIGSWYLLGILIPTAAGAVLGPRILHW